MGQIGRVLGRSSVQPCGSHDRIVAIRTSSSLQVLYVRLLPNHTLAETPRLDLIPVVCVSDDSGCAPCHNDLLSVLKSSKHSAKDLLFYLSDASLHQTRDFK